MPVVNPNSIVAQSQGNTGAIRSVNQNSIPEFSRPETILYKKKVSEGEARDRLANEVDRATQDYAAVLEAPKWWDQDPTQDSVRHRLRRADIYSDYNNKNKGHLRGPDKSSQNVFQDTDGRVIEYFSPRGCTVTKRFRGRKTGSWQTQTTKVDCKTGRPVG